MPVLLRDIAKSINDDVYVEMSAPGGYDFERHYKLAETTTALGSRKWDYIVLQESGWRTAYTASLAEKNIYPFADSLKKVINQNNSKATLVLYMTNGYIDGVNAFGDTAWCRADPQVCSLDGMQARIKDNYQHLSTQLNAAIAPCGIIWKILKTKNNNLVLHDADRIHPNLAGSYANAVTIYSIIRKKRLKDIFSPPGIEPQQAALIQNTVSDVLFDCNPDWKSY